MRQKAIRLLAKHTDTSIRELRDDDDEMLRGEHHNQALSPVAPVIDQYANLQLGQRHRTRLRRLAYVSVALLTGLAALCTAMLFVFMAGSLCMLLLTLAATRPRPATSPRTQLYSCLLCFRCGLGEGRALRGHAPEARGLCGAEQAAAADALRLPPEAGPQKLRRRRVDWQAGLEGSLPQLPMFPAHISIHHIAPCSS